MRHLSKFNWNTQDGEYKLYLREDLYFYLGLGLKGIHIFTYREKEIGNIFDDVLCIRSGYAWNICSPAFSIIGIRIGTPSPELVYLASLIHDFLYQFGGLPCNPWTKKQADDVFYNMMIKQGYKLAGLYHYAVVKFGKLRINTDPELKCRNH